MKKIICIGICFLIWLNGFSQTYPIVYRSNSSLTVQDARFSAGLNFFAPRYADTTAANLNLGNDSCSAIIFTYDVMSLWVRTCAPKQWTLVGSGGGGFANPMTDEGDLIIGGVGGAAGRLAIGANTYVLTSDGTTFSWQPSAGGGGGWGFTGTVATLTGNSIVNGGGNNLTFDNLNEFTVNSPVVLFDALAGSGNGFVAVDDDGILSFNNPVTSVAWTTSQGVSASIANATTTPNITVTLGALTGVTSFNGLVVTANTGAITTGTWSATAIAATRGGTGQTVYVVGDILTANTTTTLTKIAASTIGYVLMSNGPGVAPTWQVLPSDNLVVQSVGGGESTWFTSGDTLYFKTINGATSGADSSLTIAGGGTGNVSNTGTPLNNQLAIWTNATTIEGVANLTFSASTLSVGVAGAATGILTVSGVTSGTVTIQPASAAGTYTLTLPVDDGTSNQFLQTNGSGVLTWATAAGSGDVSKVGTPVNNQIGVWTGDGTIEGDANLTFAAATLSIGVAGAATGIFTQSGVTSGTITFQPASAAGTYTLTWPTTDGGVNEFLQTDGSGVLTWAAGAGNVSNTGTPVDNQLAVWTNATTIEGDADLVFNGTQLGIQGTPGFALDIWNGAYGTIVAGADLNASTRTNSTTKNGGIATPHYTNAEEPFNVIRWVSSVSANTVAYGAGVNPGYNSATTHQFFTATNNTTLVGTMRFELTNTVATFNGGTANYNFAIGGDVDASTFFVDADAITNGAVGIGTATPTSKLQVAGSFSLPYTATATSLNADATHHTIDVTATGQTITLPTAVGCSGRIYTIKLTASGTGTVATTSSQNIDASTTYSLSAQYKYVTVQSTNANWVIIANN